MGQTQVASLITDTQRGQSPARAKDALKQAAFIDF